MVRHCYCSSSKVKDMIFFCVTMRYDVRKKFRKLHFVKHFLQNERKKGAQHFLFLQKIFKGNYKKQLDFID